jgi:E3 ubiquitin-protein ligase SIAH1
MVPPIIVACRSGHSVCSKCAEELDRECPTCKEPVVNIRNIVMENVARRIRYPCVNKKWGCNKTFTIDGIIDHQSTCFYGNVPCPWFDVPGKCAGFEGDINDLKRHLTDSHADGTKEVLDGNTFDGAISTFGRKELFPERIIATLGEIFTLCASFRNNKFYCIVQYIGPENEVDKYKYKFSVIVKEELRRFQ